MARRESEREDLLREATSLRDRAEFEVLGFDEPVVVGFRAEGSGSIFFGADQVYQFNSRLELRRAFSHDRMIKAVHGKLASLRRERSEGRVQLLRHDFTDEETFQFIRELEQRIRKLRLGLESQDYQVIGVVPDSNVVNRITTWIASIDRPLQIADKPNVS